MKWLWVTLLFSATLAYSNCRVPAEGWSVDVGGTYTWMSFTTPPTYTGSTGGVLAKLTYQRADEFFGQARSFYNLGPLSSSLNTSAFSEWYSEFIGGYCFSSTCRNWLLTPYAGLGLDFLHDNHSAYASISAIELRYNIYYAVAGLDIRYSWKDWMFGVQGDCLPIFNQFLKVKTLPEAAWILKNRVGGAVRLPLAYRYARNFWVELTPYYRFLPIGASNTLGLPERNLSQWGAFLSFRFFL